jgi:hypothetical protein
MSNKKRLIIAIFSVAVMLIFLSLILPGGMFVFVRDNAGTVYYEKSVRPGDVVSMEITHSVQKVRIVDNLTVLTDGRLLLTDTTFGSSGYGIPSELFYNITVDSDGNYTIKDINQTFESINFLTGNLPKNYLTVAGEKYPIYSVVPEGKPVILSVERITLAETVFNKIRAILSF